MLALKDVGDLQTHRIHRMEMWFHFPKQKGCVGWGDGSGEAWEPQFKSPAQSQKWVQCHVCHPSTGRQRQGSMVRQTN